MTAHTDATLRVEARFKNARLYNAIVNDPVPTGKYFSADAQQARPIKAWCQHHGIQHGMVYNLLNLKISPILSGQQGFRKGPPTTRPICTRIATLLDCEVAWLFPEALYNVPWGAIAVEVHHERFLPLARAPRQVFELQPAQLDTMIHDALQGTVQDVLETITPREEKVITQRFGLNGEDVRTLDEVAAYFGVSRERIRQIEAKALRKLRHPSRSKKLWPFI